MTLPKRYDPKATEPELQEYWERNNTNRFDAESGAPVFSIDTPPPTVSGNLHLGHVYSYSHADFIARFWRMNGHNVFYPIGYDDNGLPTERLVEKRLGIKAQDVGRRVFIEKCLEVGAQAEEEYEALWRRLGLSVDWSYTYRTIDELSRRTAQYSFLDLHRKDRVYRRKAPTIWCPECQTAIAQAELSDVEQSTEFVTLAFRAGGVVLPIATTRPELLPACVAIFVHPTDARYTALLGQTAQVPLFGQHVPILADPLADPEKGSGAVMCCTFGDTTDIEWWYKHDLPLIEAIDRSGRMTAVAGEFAGLPAVAARKKVIAKADAEGLVLERKAIVHTVRVHERDDVPVEYIVTNQWFVRVLDVRDELVRAGDVLHWHPPQMVSRYRDWVANLNWDWAISRQRYFGVTFPLWYCSACSSIVLADESQLPIDPSDTAPPRNCDCGSDQLTPETDVFDTWFTSSMSPQIITRWLTDPRLHERLFPMTLRPQAHEIIRTWAFYTIVKAHFHHGKLPWTDVAISGWGLAGEGMAKISKSRGGGPMSPMEMIEKYSADAVRYWAASTGLGKDSVISEEKIQIGGKLITKLWNVASFTQRFLADFAPRDEWPALAPTDRWNLARLQALIFRATELFRSYDYAAAKAEIEAFFWRDLADNYLELVKARLYDGAHVEHDGARATLRHVLLTMLQLFAPFLPFVTEDLHRKLFAGDADASIDRGPWPQYDAALADDQADRFGEAVIEVATAVRRYKSEQQISLGAELATMQLATEDPALGDWLRASVTDLRSVTRARDIQVVDAVDAALGVVADGPPVTVAIVA